MELLQHIGIGLIILLVGLIALAMTVREAVIKLRQVQQGVDAMEKLNAMEKGDHKNGNGKVA